jgi:hypothetical protein
VIDDVKMDSISAVRPEDPGHRQVKHKSGQGKRRTSVAAIAMAQSTTPATKYQIRGSIDCLETS